MTCRICGCDGLEPLGVDAFLFPGTSSAPDFHQYENFICPGCGVVSGLPEPTDEALTEHYNSAYRISRDAVEIGGNLVDTPIDLTVGGRSLSRVRNFHDMVTNNQQNYPDIVPTKDNLVIDFGAYQGMFLHGVKELWNCHCLAYDYSKAGIAFAQTFLGFDRSRVAQDIYTDTFDKKARFATMIHALEHFREPVRFLQHLRDDILTENGYLYIEVPNLYGIALCEPVHFFTYTTESLQHLLNLSGFEVLDICTSGYPVVEEFTAHNNEQNIICMAKPANTATTAVITKPNLAVIRRQLRASYAKHSRATITKQFRKAVHEAVKFFYYLTFAGFLDSLSSSLSKWLAQRLGRR